MLVCSSYGLLGVRSQGRLPRKAAFVLPAAVWRTPLVIAGDCVALADACRASQASEGLGKSQNLRSRGFDVVARRQAGENCRDDWTP